MLISIPFLIATFVVYAIVPRHQTVHGRNLLCYIASLTIYYILIVITGFLEDDIGTGPQCKTMGYLIYYFGLTNFFWLNVICIEIFSKFSNLSGKPKFDLVLFFKYCTYGFGAPLLITLLIYLLDHTLLGSIMNDKYLPKLGIQQDNESFECFIQCKCVLFATKT